ncbi:MAG: murein biosynthesis integral membrane protein MurJ [Anaerolineae bacterium]|nr:murein biosynthesis integral membrane protein MurJ [Anaerolineae bacterium]
MPTMKPELPDQNAAARSQLFAAAGFMGAATIISRLLGLVRAAVITAYFGADTLEANAIAIASRLPDALFFIMAGGALASAFLPTFSAYFAREDETGAWQLFAAVINLITLLMVLIAGLAAIFARPILTIYVGDLVVGQPGFLEMTVPLMRVMLLTPIIFGISGVFMAALNARQHFLLPALAGILYNVGIILGVWLLAPNVMGMGIGTVLGALAHLLVQLPGLRRQNARYTPVLTLYDPGVRQVLRLMAPRVLGLSFSQLNHLLIPFLAQAMIFGAIPALNYAWLILNMPLGMIGQAMAIAAFPTFATLAAQSALPQMRHILADSLRLIFFLSLPATVLLMVLSRPIIIFLFERGAFDQAATTLVTSALLFFALGLTALAAIEVLSRAFYALGDTVTPVVAGGLQMGLMVLLSLWLSRSLFPRFGWPDFGGLALGISVANWLEMVALAWWLRRKMGGMGAAAWLDGVWRMGLATGGMALVTGLGQYALAAAPVVVQLLAGTVVGGGTYLLLCLAFRVHEVEQIWRYGKRWLMRMDGE